MENLAKRMDLDDRPDTVGADASDGDTMLHLVSHEIRESVRALVELPLIIADDLARLGQRPMGPVAQHLQLMTDHGARLDRLMNDVIIHSRIGRMQTLRRMNLKTAIDDVLADGVLPRGFRLRHDLRQSWIDIGERDLMVLLAALLRNAAQHHDKTSGNVFIRCHRDADMAVLQVLDDGPGIPEEFRGKVLDPLTTLGPRQPGRSNGMGLAHAAKIARRYGGSIRLDDGLKGRGTCVELRLPLAPAAGQRMRTLPNG
ncbi:sensor histidine kinase [Mesobacterium pallidum]|uniref:sensor histidine kinase n=1 Tax=Mesobacterium pallidum TaxID=2872037 RepID=UPI001EE1589A|nr:HAMP domain-containing sensor histidine kinase [Mesobacterium pallidum]